MLLIAIRRMLSNKWMLFCTLLGSVITVALLGSIPTYTEGIMQRMLTKDLEISQQQNGKYAGGYQINYQGYYSNANNELFKSFDKTISEEISNSVGIPIVTKVLYKKGSIINISGNDDGKSSPTNPCSLSGLDSHIKMVAGRLYSDKVVDGVYEVILSEEAMKTLNLTLDNTYEFSNETLLQEGKDVVKLRIKVVGIFTYKNLNDLYWFNDIKTYNTSMFFEPGLLQNLLFTDGKLSIYSACWYYAYDFYKIKVSGLVSLVDTFNTHDKWFQKYKPLLEYSRSADPILKQYDKRVAQLRITLLVLQIPVLVMLAFFTFMVFKLKINFESNEIAIVKSRGGSSFLVFGTYFIESAIIGIIALIFGPILGLYLCKVLGASNGFLEFVQRAPLELSLKGNTYLYSAIGVIFISFSMLIPAFIASRISIVLYKQKNARHRKTSFWKKFYLDIVLLAIAFYGLYSYKRQQKILFVNGASGSETSVDPLLYGISVVFIFGCGMLFLRIFPYIIQFIFWLGRKMWNPVFYASFIQVGRTKGQEQFTMFFIILTLSVGILSANSARTINKNMEEKIRYEVGADIVTEGIWKNNQSSMSSLNPFEGENESQRDMIYFEPSFDTYTKLEGAESVTKVYKNENTNVLIGDKSQEKVMLMGVISNEFGKIAWFREDLLPYHWYQYLNLLTDSPSAVLVSKAFKEKLGVNEGDSITVSWGEDSSITGIVYAFLDYWPSINPNKKTDNLPNPYFVVGNLQFIQDMNRVEPYQVWLKKKPGVTSIQIKNEMDKNKIEIASIADASQKIIINKNDPMLQGTNGSLTLSFVVTIIITILGFLIYWILSIKKRVLQFGIFRAIGMSAREIIGMIALEQLLITGGSIFAGIQLGNITSRIFVVLFQMAYGSESQVPPFRVVSDMNDYIRLYVIVFLMLVTCFYIIGRFVLKLNVSQALKLGED